MRGWDSATRILCVRLDSIGDVLMTTPAIRAVREARPSAHIALLTSPAGAAVAALIPEIDEVIIYAAPWMKVAGSTVAGDFALIERLRAERFEAAIIFTVFSQNPLPAALTCRLAYIPLVLAYSRERAYSLLSDEVTETEPQGGIQHEAQRQLNLVAKLGWRPSSERLSLHIPAAATARAQGLIAGSGLSGSWAVVHPGASAASRRYPVEGFAAVMRRLHDEHGWRFAVIGDAGERDLAVTLITTSGVPAVNLAGKLDLATTAALIAVAPLLIANNSGPSHLAAAVGTPVVVLYALTNPQHTPWQVAHRVLTHDVPCRWCFKSVCPEGHHLCLRGVVSEAVVDAALELTQTSVGVAA